MLSRLHYADIPSYNALVDLYAGETDPIPGWLKGLVLLTCRSNPVNNLTSFASR
ncbi:MAG: hypothetical protein ACREQW_03190 [Candidatus Binatia bacterium]